MHSRYAEAACTKVVLLFSCPRLGTGTVLVVVFVVPVADVGAIVFRFDCEGVDMIPVFKSEVL